MEASRWLGSGGANLRIGMIFSCHPSTRSKAHKFMKVVFLSWSDDVLKKHFSFHSDQQSMGDHGYSMRVFSYQ